MTDEVLINATPRETRIARLENSMLQEIRIEYHRNQGSQNIVGNIYLGTVVRVLAGMQAAFIDIGLARTAFVHARDLATDLTHNAYPQPAQQPAAQPSITSLLHEGQKITLQAIKNPIGDKGARLSGRISIASRNLVYLPNSAYLGISRQVCEPAAQELLWSVFNEVRHAVFGDGDGQMSDRQADGQAGGFIIRTAAITANAQDIRSDMEFVMHTWQRIRQRQTEQSAAALLHRDLPAMMRTLRDLDWQKIKKVRIDCLDTYQQIMAFAAQHIPAAVMRIEHYRESTPIFDRYAVEEDIGKALLRRVRLKSGGYLVFDRTEAMTTVDVNTGSFVGKHNFEETVLQTNLEAVVKLAQQLRMRNIGGIIIVDFIDMKCHAHRAQVVHELEREMACDSDKTKVHEMTSLGLVEITRQRTSESLEQLLSEPCPTCSGYGMRKTAHAIVSEIFREILRQTNRCHTTISARGTTEKYLVIAAHTVIDYLRENESDSLADLQKSTGRAIQLQAEPSYRQEQFDVVTD